MEKFEVGDTVFATEVALAYDPKIGIVTGNVKSFIFYKNFPWHNKNTVYVIGRKGFDDRLSISGINLKTTRMILTEKTWKYLT